MTDNELIADFFEPRANPDGIELWVCKITWNGPHTPVSNWISVDSFPQGADPAQIHKRMLSTLKLKKYFKVCDVCGEKQPSGWMAGMICHSCTETMGVRF